MAEYSLRPLGGKGPPVTVGLSVCFYLRMLLGRYSSLECWATGYVLVDDLFKSVLSLQDELDCIPGCAFSASMLGNEVRLFFHLLAGIRNRYGQTATPHHREVHEIVTNESDFRFSQFLYFK